MFYQDPTLDQFNFAYQFDYTSTQADSSDGSEQCFAYLPQVVKYKTQPCKNFSLIGYCSYGDKCQFAHGNYELNPVLCGNLYKTRKCKNFWKKGYCLYGIRCQFLHSQCAKPPSQQNSLQYLKNKKHSYLDYKTESRILSIL